MHTKLAKDLINHFLQGGTVTDFKGNIPLADGITLTYSDWLGNNSDLERPTNFLFSSANYRNTLHKFGVVTGENKDSLIALMFPFSVDMVSLQTSYNSNLPSNYDYIVTSGKAASYSGISSHLIYFGSSNIAESETDYTLKSPLSGVYPVSSTINTSDDYFTLNVKNWTDSDATVKEIGSFLAITSGKNGFPANLKLSNTNVFMVARKVLENPIEIKAGEIGQIYLK